MRARVASKEHGIDDVDRSAYTCSVYIIARIHWNAPRAADGAGVAKKKKVEASSAHLCTRTGMNLALSSNLPTSKDQHEPTAFVSSKP